MDSKILTTMTRNNKTSIMAHSDNGTDSKILPTMTGNNKFLYWNIHFIGHIMAQIQDSPYNGRI